jgi:hypothetical protein
VYTAPKKNSIAIALRIDRSRRASDASIRRLPSMRHARIEQPAPTSGACASAAFALLNP